MRLSTKGRFAVTAMIDIALRKETGPVPLSDIALRHQISLSYLEQMFSKLRQHGLVESTRGPGGGYALARSAERITVADIVGAIEGHTDSSAKGVTRGGEPTVQDMTQDLSEALNSKVLDYLQSVTLYSLVLAQYAKGFRLEERKPARQGIFKKPPSESPANATPNSVFALGKSLLARG